MMHLILADISSLARFLSISPPPEIATRNDNFRSLLSWIAKIEAPPKRAPISNSRTEVGQTIILLLLLHPLVSSPITLSIIGFALSPKNYPNNQLCFSFRSPWRRPFSNFSIALGQQVGDFRRRRINLWVFLSVLPAGPSPLLSQTHLEIRDEIFTGVILATLLATDPIS